MYLLTGYTAYRSAVRLDSTKSSLSGLRPSEVLAIDMRAVVVSAPSLHAGLLNGGHPNTTG